ncbi:MAG: hypothetical protein Q9O62_11675 [Ardenticatenia bacterium]|nr:hypothetical protein [Ardenticatenia bacterium]
MTTGGSVLHGVRTLREAGLVVEDVVVLVDREAGATDTLASHGLRLHAAFRLSDIVRTLHDVGDLPDDTFARVHAYVQNLRAGRE